MPFGDAYVDSGYSFSSILWAESLRRHHQILIFKSYLEFRELSRLILKSTRKYSATKFKNMYNLYLNGLQQVLQTPICSTVISIYLFLNSIYLCVGIEMSTLVGN